MVSEGVLLMVVGMTTVFAFLGLLVALMQGSAAFFAAFAERFPEPELMNVGGQTTSTKPGTDEEIAIVLAAVEAYRRGGTGA